MKPELLTFSGLRSYVGTASIDFSDLGLFAIIGDTGSGKSTIIEALSLALYGRPTWTARLDGLVSDGADAWQVELTFVAGGERWQVSRRRGRGASVDKLEQLDGGAVKVDGAGAVTEKVIELVGLDHQQFTSAVVLPQGRFEKLLVAGDTERSKLLTSILGLQELEATRALAERIRDRWRPDVEVWGRLRDELGPDPAGAAAEASKRAEIARERADRLSTASERSREIERELSGIDSLHAELRSRLEALTPLPSGFGEQLAAAHASWSKATDDLRGADEQLTTIQEQLAALDQQAAEVLGDFADRDALVVALSTADRVASRLPGARQAVEGAEVAAKAAAGEAPPSQIDESLLTAATAAEQAVVEVEDRRRSAQAALEAGSAAWRALCERRDAVAALREQLPAAEEEVAGAEEARDEAATRVAEAEAALEAAESAWSAALVADAAATAGAGCTPGDDCPVCARELPADWTPPAPGAEVEAAEEQRASARKAVDAARRSQSEVARRIDQAEAALERLRGDLSAAEEREQEAIAEAAAAGIVLDADDDDAALAGLAQAVSEAEGALTSAREAAATAVAARDAAREELDALRRAHDQRVAQAAAEVRSAANALASLVAELDDIRVEVPADIEPEQRAAAVIDALSAVRSQLDQLDSQRQELVTQGRAAQAERDAVAESAQEAREGARDLVRQLRDRYDAVAKVHAAVAGVPGEAAIPALPAEPPAVSGPADLASMVDGLGSLLGALDALVAAAEERIAEAAKVRDELVREQGELVAAAGCEDVAGLHAVAGSARSEADNAAQEATRLGAAATQAAQLDERLAVARPFLANLEVLREALRNTNFVAHLVAARETELLAEASQRLSDITGGRFGFGAGFKVVNRHSGEVRAALALSGGERFQAALALALALTEIASRGSRGRLEAVFIDEGFGSLDGAALEQALDRLRSVSGDGTMVALVSHLRAVAEHVGDVLHVTKDDTTGSRIQRLDDAALERMLDDDVRSGLTA